jgi:hypothetical protein
MTVDRRIVTVIIYIVWLIIYYIYIRLGYGYRFGFIYNVISIYNGTRAPYIYTYKVRVYI